MQKLRIESSETGKVFGVVSIGLLIASCDRWNLTGIRNNHFVA
jgi:hypothetical protein